MRPVWIIEIGAFAAIIAVSFALCKGRGRSWAEWPLAALGRLGLPSPLLAFCLTFALAAFLSVIRPPAPIVHDELSYALAADTFSSGRLTNPPHPFWQHFETMHVLQQPTYQSRYPPGEGLVMAFGRLLAGSYIVGVWLAMSAASAALYWALSALLPARWAMLGALLPILRFGALGIWDSYYYAYWTASYWGGALALVGGSLLFGAAPRLWRRPGVRDALVFAAGLAILALTRPYEGVVISVPLGCVSLAGIVRARAWRTLAAPALLLAGAAAFLALYNQRVTGSALRFPHTEYSRQYGVVPYFRFQPLRPAPQYRHEILRQFHTGFRVQTFESQKATTGFDVYDANLLARFFLGLALTPIFLLGFLWRSPWRTLAVLLLVASAASHAITGAHSLRPHYFAPFVPALLLLTVQGLRVLKTFRRTRPGLHASQAVLGVVLVSFLAAAALRAFAFHPALNVYERKITVAAALQPLAPSHLVFVRYRPNHDIHEEWVYNAADIDASSVVWAREMSAAENQRLRDYYANRMAWVVFADERPPRLVPYSPE